MSIFDSQNHLPVDGQNPTGRFPGTHSMEYEMITFEPGVIAVNHADLKLDGKGSLIGCCNAEVIVAFIPDQAEPAE